MAIRRGVILLWCGLLLATGAAAQVPAEDPSELGAGGTYRVYKLVPIPKVPDEEVRTKRPSPNYIWVPGYWERKTDDWHWVRGRWALPPESGATWQAGHWRQQGGGTNWLTGEFFYYTTRLSQGLHSYTFRTSDGVNLRTFGPFSMNVNPAPNSAPSLSSPFVSPLIGTPQTNITLKVTLLWQ